MKNISNNIMAISEWVMKNPEKGRKEYPELYNKLITVIDGYSPYQHVQIIQCIVDSFPKWKNEISSGLLPNLKKKKVEDYLEILTLIMTIDYEEEVILDEIKKQESYFIEMYNFLQKVNANLTSKLSFNWLVNPKEELLKTFDYLKEKKLISPLTFKEDFIIIFSSNEINSIKPIEWIGQKNLLAYFIDELYEKKKIPSNTNLWSIAKRCFVNGSNLAQLKENYRSNTSGKPKNYLLIDQLFENSLQ